MEQKREDTYELTRILFRQLDFLSRTLGAYKLSRHKEAIIGILEFIADNQDLFTSNFQEKTRFVTKYFNQLGGVKPIAYQDRTFFKLSLEIVRSDIQSLNVNT